MMKNSNEVNFNYPEAFNSQWDDIEIERCRTEFDGTTYPIHDDNDVLPGDFWSVYVHMVEGGVMCIADVPTEEMAIQLHDMLSRAVKTYKDNGHLK